MLDMIFDNDIHLLQLETCIFIVYKTNPLVSRQPQPLLSRKLRSGRIDTRAPAAFAINTTLHGAASGRGRECRIEASARPKLRRSHLPKTEALLAARAMSRGASLKHVTTRRRDSHYSTAPAPQGADL